MAVGPYTWFNQALKKIADGTINLNGTSFKAVLTTVSQSLSKTFDGSSGFCRYSDLTAELATANGYTNGGLALAAETLSRSANVVKWTADPISWTLSGTISFKYLVIFDDGATNKDLLCFCDLDVGGSVNIDAIPPTLLITPDALGMLTWSQP